MAQEILPFIDKMKLSKYVLEEIKVLTPKLMTIHNKNINKITIIKDFDNNIFPILQIETILRPDEYFTITDNIKNVTVNLTLKSYKQDKNKPDNSKFLKKVISGTFKCIHEEVSPFLEGDLYEMYRDKEANEPNDENKLFVFNLFNKNHITRYRTIINDVLRNVTVADAIIYSCNKCGIDNGLIQQPDNKSNISQMLLPAANLLGMINYIHQYYGIYNNDLIMFQDYNTFYLMDKDPCKVWRPNEIKTVFINIADFINKDKLTVGTYVDGVNRIIVNVVEGIKIFNRNIGMKETYADDLMIITNRDNNITHVKSNMKANGPPNTKILINHNNNKYLNNSLKHRLDENNFVLVLKLNEINYDYMLPNKKYIINFSNTKINNKFGGIYRLSKIIYVFNKDGNNFVLGAELELRKC